MLTSVPKAYIPSQLLTFLLRAKSPARCGQRSFVHDEHGWSGEIDLVCTSREVQIQILTLTLVQKSSIFGYESETQGVDTDCKI